MNNDIVVTDPGWLARLQEVAYAKDGTELVAPPSSTPPAHQPPGQLHAAVSLYGQQLGAVSATSTSAAPTVTSSASSSPRPTSPACIDRVGPLDEDLFAYFDDTDYCFRAQRRASAWCTPAASVRCTTTTPHPGEQVDFCPVYEASRRVFRRKWGQWVDHDPTPPKRCGTPPSPSRSVCPSFPARDAGPERGRRGRLAYRKRLWRDRPTDRRPAPRTISSAARERGRRPARLLQRMPSARCAAGAGSAGPCWR